MGKLAAWLPIVTGIVLIAYVVIGGVIFRSLEHENEAKINVDTKTFTDQFLQNHSCISQEKLLALTENIIKAYENGLIHTNETEDDSDSKWNYYNSIFFAVTVVTTIGYGNQTPSTSGGRLFCIFFALFGIPLCLTCLAFIGQRVVAANKWLTLKLLKRDKMTHHMKFWGVLLITIIGSCLLIFVPSVIFTRFEEWSMGTAVYFSIITLSTIGFGDYVAGFSTSDVPKSRLGVYRICIGIWILIGLAWFASIITAVQELMENTSKKIVQETTEPTENQREVENNNEKSLKAEPSYDTKL